MSIFPIIHKQQTHTESKHIQKTKQEVMGQSLNHGNLAYLQGLEKEPAHSAVSVPKLCD